MAPAWSVQGWEDQTKRVLQNFDFWDFWEFGGFVCGFEAELGWFCLLYVLILSF